MQNCQRKVTRRGQTLRYPWNEMNKGDWFDVPGSMTTANAVCAAVSMWKRGHPGATYETTTIINARGRSIIRVTRTG